MKQRTVFLTLVITLFNLMAFGQENDCTLSGKIRDADTGEDLIGAVVSVKDKPCGTVTNSYGFYSLTLAEGTYTLEVNFMGYDTQVVEIMLNKDIRKDFSLSLINEEIEEVVVNSERADKNVSSTVPGRMSLDIKEIEAVPVLMGEKDILKTIQLLPGISTVSEGGAGFSVRGGSIDQNLILLDEAPVYGASHLMGFFSVFNSDALKDASVYKGGIPANYGGRASSVIDIIMKDGNSKQFSMSGGLGLISSRLTVEGPIVKDQSSFIISGRRSYADLLAKATGFLDDNITMYFYDLNTKVNYKLNENNRIFLSGYFGEDDFGFDETGLDWGNKTATLRWNSIVNSRTFSNTSFIYSNYTYGFNLGDMASLTSGIIDYGVKQDFTNFISTSNTLRFGFASTYHTFNPGVLDFSDSEDTKILLQAKQALESAVYISNEHAISDKFSATYGLRLSVFNQLGEGTAYTYDEANTVIDSVRYEKGECMQNYIEYEPRLSVNYRSAKNSSVKASYNRMAQYLHLLSNSTSGQPTDTWIPSSVNLKPMTVTQFSLGYFRNFIDNTYEFSLEAYYKDMNNVTDFEDGTNLLLNDNIEANILAGKGRSYGAELYFKKKYGKLTGWFSYTLSRTEKQIDGINNGDWYQTKYDKIHDFSAVVGYKLTKRLSVSANWVYYTGNAVTFPSGAYTYNGQIWPYYTERNGYRMPDCHRLDVNVHLKNKIGKRFESSWDFSIYNVYNRYNAYTITFQESETNPGTTEAVKLSLFGIVPSVSFNFKF